MATAPSPRDQRRLLREQARYQRNTLRAQRRSSILGPLLLLGIGVTLLLVQVGRVSPAVTLRLFGRFWPLLLIGAGVVRLIEWFIDQRRQSDAISQGLPYAPRTTGGAVAMLLILLTIAGVAATISQQGNNQPFGHDLQFNSDNLQEFFGNKHESDESLSEPCPDGSILTVQNPRGDVTVAGTSTDGLLHLTAHNEVYSSSDSEAARQAKRLAPRLERNGNSLSLALPSIDGARADLTITVPQATTIVATTGHGDLRINSVHAATATANHGDLDLSTIDGPAIAHINQGDSSFAAHKIGGPLSLEGRGLDVTLSDVDGPVNITGDFFGTLHLERNRDKVHLHTSRIDLQVAKLIGELETSQNADLTADQIVGPVVLNTRNRNVTLERVAGDVSLTDRNGSVTLSATSPVGTISVENRNGSIDLTVPENADFTLSAETTNADLNNDLGLTSKTDGNRSFLNGTVGKGGPPVRLVTSQADLTIHRADVQPVVVAPSATPDPGTRSHPLTSSPSRTSREARTSSN